jgi:hypothetical protein
MPTMITTSGAEATDLSSSHHSQRSASPEAPAIARLALIKG